MNKKNLVVIIILLAAALLRFWCLGRGDTVNDEVFYAFRAIGPLDFDHAEFQTTPLEWFDSRQNFAPQNLGGQAGIPFWTKLSFHDHPPLVFWVQHFFIKVFGENNFAFRLPSALFGIGSVYILYLLGSLLYSRAVGLVSGSLFALTLNHVYISRTGLQESYVIFFILLTACLFLKALKNDNYFLWAGASLGLAFLAKYTAFILVPIFFTYLLIFDRSKFFNKKLWIGLLLVILLFSPVIIYNFKLYQTVGHFDFQFSYFFGQNPEAWQVAPGKEIGTLAERIKNFIPRLISTNSPSLLLIFGFSLIGFCFNLFRDCQKRKENYFILLSLFFLIILLLFVGPSFRFLTMLTPLIVLVATLGSVNLYQLSAKKMIWRSILLTLFLIWMFFEVFYSVNSQIAYYPRGNYPWLFSKIRYENYNWGYNELDSFLKKELAGKMPSRVFDMQYNFLEKIRDADLLKARAAGLKSYPALIVYYGNFDDGAKLWVLERLATYHGWPVIEMEDYFGFLRKNGPEFFAKSGFREYYFITMNNIESSSEVRALIKNLPYNGIFNQKGEEVFRVYRLQI
mgnify:CR=1 FL=1